MKWQKPKFDNGDMVKLISGEIGEITGVSWYEKGTRHNYLIKYINKCGCLVEQWWDENVIQQKLRRSR